jgi:hypothetical protein
MAQPQPQITYAQNPLSSLTILVNVFGSILVWVVAKYGLGTIFTPDTVNQVATGLALAVMSVANVVVRKYTNGALSFSAPLSQPAAQDLPTGTVAVTTPHPDMPGTSTIVALPVGTHTISVKAVPVPPPPQPPVVLTPAVVVQPPTPVPPPPPGTQGPTP